MKKEWYNHLELLGFVDIEKKSDNVSLFTGANYTTPPEETAALFPNTRLSYYQWVGQKLENSRFRSETDRLIWEYHSEGLSRREIAPRIGLHDRWVGRKLEVIEGYLNDKVFTVASASYASA